MPGLETLPSWMTPLLAALAVLLVLLAVVQALLPVIRVAPGGRAARARVSAAVARGSDTALGTGARAHAFVDAGREAMTSLRRPRLAARYAQHALALAPGDRVVIDFAIEAMRAAKRHVGLERALWVSLDHAENDATFDTAKRALASLYEGPLARPERARVLAGLSRILERTPGVPAEQGPKE